nr:uncharacterized protein LOC120366082 [Saimiri boliviensis boliviensis]
MAMGAWNPVGQHIPMLGYTCIRKSIYESARSAASPPPTNHERAPPPSPSANGRKPAGRADEAHGPHERGGGDDSVGAGENTTWRRAGRTELQQRPREEVRSPAEGSAAPPPAATPLSPSLVRKLPHTHTPLLGSPGRAGTAPALLRSRAMQRPRHGGRKGKACVTENGARAKRGHKQDGGHAVCTVSPFPLPLPGPRHSVSCCTQKLSCLKSRENWEGARTVRPNEM